MTSYNGGWEGLPAGCDTLFLVSDIVLQCS